MNEKTTMHCSLGSSMVQTYRINCMEENPQKFSFIYDIEKIFDVNNLGFLGNYRTYKH